MLFCPLKQHINKGVADMEHKLTCPKCGVELPLFTEHGKHNFCPSSEYKQGKIVELCMKCKMEEVVVIWQKGGRHGERR